MHKNLDVFNMFPSIERHIHAGRDAVYRQRARVWIKCQPAAVMNAVVG